MPPTSLPTQIPLPTATFSATDIPSVLRYLALGDSYTVGEGVSGEESWPTQLSIRLAEQGYVFDQLDIIARTGWTTSELRMGIDKQALQGPYQLVSLLIGVNNQYRGEDMDEYQRTFRLLLEQAIGFAGGDAGRVLVLSIPDWSATPFAEGLDRALIAQQIDAFNATNYEESMKANARYVDITPISRKAPLNPDWITFDGLHPSGEMYRAWVEQALPTVLEMLGLQVCKDCSQG